jgi:tetratricopeptide (TPR) repeat protein
MQLPLQQFSRSNRIFLGAIFISLIVTFLHVPFLNGTFAALVMAVISQIYLPGYLLARALGKNSSFHPISRFAWTLVCGLGLTVTLGAAARVLNIPVPIYLLVLHGIMLGLALLPRPSLSASPFWRLTRQNLPLYVAVAVSCLTVLGVSYESRYRFFGFEDQPIFISLVDWMAAHPDVRPNDVPLRSRQIGVLNGDTRFDSDGWSYNQAAWVWVSGVPARQIVWYDLGALFVWAVPLLTFALAYELTGKESTAAGSAVAVAIVGLMTLDNIVYNPGYSAFGRFAVFQINVLRQMSITIMLPLALLAGLAYLKNLRRGDLIATALAGLALASMHPIQATIFVMSAGATAALVWLAAPSRSRFVKLLPFALVLLLILALPFVQRFNREGLTEATTIIRQDDLESATTQVNDAFLVLRDLPIIGTTYIRNPADVFYSPVIVLAVILSLASGWWWRRSLAAQYLFSNTLLAMLIFFLPGLTELFNKIASSVGLLTAMLMIPVPLALSIPFSLLRDSISLDTKNTSDKTSRFPAELARWSGLIVFLLALIWLIYEPIPLRASARDQLRAYNAMQSLRHLHPAQTALADSLRTHLPADTITILATPYDVANVVIEELPDTLITSGRRNRNLAIEGNNRFMNEGAAEAPWLDGDDLTFLGEWGVTHIVTVADMTRLPQMLLQPERFERLDTPAGYAVFSVMPSIESDAIDALYGEMNRLYATMERPRWDRQGFNLILPGDVEAWKPMVAEWKTILAEQPENERARLGLAFTYTMMGVDADALPLWQRLNETYPDVPVYADALASTLQAVDPAGNSATPLFDALTSPYDAARVLAVRRLLTEMFVYRLDDERMQQVVNVTENDAVTWERLANLGQQEPIRQRAALFMDAGQWEAAAASLDALPVPERAPEDLIARATIQLVQGDVPGALDILRPATDPDQITSNVYLHPDRWENNTAAQTYYLLLGELAFRDQRLADAEVAYEQAIVYGSNIAGKYFLGMLLQIGTDGQRIERGNNLLTQANAEWSKTHNTTRPSLDSILTITDERNFWVTRPSLPHFPNVTVEQSIVFYAILGAPRPRDAYPIRTWRIQVVSPDSTTKYAETEIPIELVDGAFISIQTSVRIPAEVPELTPALVYLEGRYNDAVTIDPVIMPIVLNRPESIEIPADAQPANLQFATDLGWPLALQAYQAEYEDNTLNMALYWQTDLLLAEDYQVFVHVVDANGQQVGGGDGAPVNNRYPTSQWRTGVTIFDPHTITFDNPLPPGEYSVRIGLYRLPSGERLAVTPIDERVQDNSVTLLNFTVE